MTRVAIVTTAEAGHVNPMLGVAQALVRGGHTVGWIGIPHPIPALAPHGIEVLSIPDLPPPPPLVTHGEALARLVRDPLALRSWIRTLLLDAVPGQIDPLRRALARFRPHVAALDPMLYQAVIACELDRLPWAAISSSLNPITPDAFDCDLTRTLSSLSPARAALFEQYALSPTFRIADCLSPHATTVFATEAYVGPAGPVAHLVGPSPRGQDPTPQLDEFHSLATHIDQTRAPLVYASFGSQISWQPQAYRTLAAAVAPLGVTLVISAGELAATSLLDGLPGRVIVRPWLPQVALLERASLFVTHGGANSVMESLTAGVPMLVSPVCNDQPIQAWFLERAGAARRLDLHSAGIAECRDVIAALLSPDAPERVAVRRISTSYRSRDGAAEAARLVTELA